MCADSQPQPQDVRVLRIADRRGPVRWRRRRASFCIAFASSFAVFWRTAAIPLTASLHVPFCELIGAISCQGSTEATIQGLLGPRYHADGCSMADGSCATQKTALSRTKSALHTARMSCEPLPFKRITMVREPMPLPLPLQPASAAAAAASHFCAFHYPCVALFVPLPCSTCLRSSQP